MRAHPHGCHIIMHSIKGVPISSVASGDLGHVQNRVTRKQDMFPDMVFGSSIRSRLFSGSYVLWLRWPFCSPLLQFSYGRKGEKGQTAVLYPGNRMGRFNKSGAKIP